MDTAWSEEHATRVPCVAIHHGMPFMFSLGIAGEAIVG